MKGFIFKSLLDFAEESFGLEFVDQMISEVQLESEGIYVTFESYPFEELVTLASYVSEHKKIAMEDLLEAFGLFILPELIGKHDYVVHDYTHPLDLIEGIEAHIHIEVRKLYDDAELPTFNNISRTENRLEIEYTSQRELSHFAIGLMKGTLKHFDTQGTVEMEKLTHKDKTTKFVIELIN